ncbi:MAG: WGR domain-containing protein [Tepidisphaeraceae bacterium]|jgi:bifunctional non-homologous end joining protein LigD
MQTVTETEKVTLYYRQGASDKVYHVAIEPSGEGFVVTFAFGRRGSTLQTGAKTAAPVDYPQAKKIFDKLVKEKTAKGYTPGEDGTPYQQTGNAERSTGILPQLLNPIDESEADRLIKDDAWWAQEKFDGKRVLICKEDNKVTGINRQGLVIDLPVPIVKAVQRLDTRRCLLDGEAVGDTFIAFDLLQEATLELAAKPYQVRYAHLVDLVDSTPSDSIRYAQTATTRAQKLTMLDRLRKERKEGIVFKRHSASYIPGRPASGGDQFKLKFTATASAIVAGANGSRRSVKLELLDGSRRIGVGNVTIPPNHPIPAVNQIVEVRYLYAYPGGSLYQPVYLGKRDDVGAEACWDRDQTIRDAGAREVHEDNSKNARDVGAGVGRGDCGLVHARGNDDGSTGTHAHQRRGPDPGADPHALIADDAAR